MQPEHNKKPLRAARRGNGFFVDAYLTSVGQSFLA